MSYFMTVAGPWIDLNMLLPIEMVTLEHAQPYVQVRKEWLTKQDGYPIFLIHDGETGTSHNFITAAEHYFQMHQTIKGTSLQALFDRFCDEAHVFRIWWASSKDDLPYRQCTSLQEVTTAVAQQIASWKDIQIRYVSAHTPAKEVKSKS